MSGILKLQIISFLSRILAMLIGIFQSLIIVNLLTKEEYGLIGLVASIAGIVGITQHLGLASSSTKEISQAKNSQSIFNVIISSLSIRLLVSVPIALVLLFFAPQIASFYSNQDLVLPLQIFGFITLIQAFQSIFNSVISGTQRFSLLFKYQVVIALVSLLVFLPLVFTYGVLGYFYALLVFNSIQTLALGFFSLRELDFKWKFPSQKEYISLSAKLLKISLAIYFVKILFTAWQEIPVAYLGKIVSLESLALFTFAFNLSSKLMAISDSVTDVNLPVFSKKSSESMHDYIESFFKNFNLLFYFIFLSGLTVAYWAKEILLGADLFIYLVGLIVGISFDKNIYDRYLDSIILFLPLLLSMIFYSYLNIFKSSYFVPMEKIRKMVIVYSSLIGLTGLSYFILRNFFNDLMGMALSLFIGALVSFMLSVYFIKKDLMVNLFDSKKIIFSLISLLVGLFSYFINLDFYSKAVIYLSFMFVVLYLFRLNLLVLFRRKK